MKSAISKISYGMMKDFENELLGRKLKWNAYIHKMNVTLQLNGLSFDLKNKLGPYFHSGFKVEKFERYVFWHVLPTECSIIEFNCPDLNTWIITFHELPGVGVTSIFALSSHGTTL